MTQRLHLWVESAFRATRDKQRQPQMLDTNRAKAISTYIENHPACKQSDQGRYIIYGGTPTKHPAYRLPLRLLIHNISNGRFRSELLEKEEQLRRKLDPTTPDDAAIIRKLLLDQNESETKALRADLLTNGQQEPGIITFDGAVINANRRMAILWTLHAETKDPRFEYIDVARLPKGVDEVDLWRIEAGLQFGKDFRLEYGGVNELLKLREGEQQGLSPKDISQALFGRFTEKVVKDKLDTLKLIESYLRFINAKGEYHRITGDLEKFISLHNNVQQPLKKKHDQKGAQVAEMIAIGFSLIQKTDLPHMEIRKLRGIATNEKARKELTEVFGNEIPGGIKEVKASRDDLVEAFTTAREVVEAQQESDKPERLIKRAQSALEGINMRSASFKSSSVSKALEKLKGRVDELIKAASKR